MSPFVKLEIPESVPLPVPRINVSTSVVLTSTLAPLKNTPVQGQWPPQPLTDPHRACPSLCRVAVGTWVTHVRLLHRNTWHRCGRLQGILKWPRALPGLEAPLQTAAPEAVGLELSRLEKGREVCFRQASPEAAVLPRQAQSPRPWATCTPPTVPPFSVCASCFFTWTADSSQGRL